MLIVTHKNGEDIQSRSKVYTLRPVRANGKGYLTPCSIQQIRTGRNFKEPYLCTVWLFARGFVDIDNLTQKDFEALGYSSKAEYLAENFNRSNPDTERVKYGLYVVEELLADLNGFGLTPQIIRGLYCE